MKRFFTLFIVLVLAHEGFSQYQTWDFTTLTSASFPTGFVTWNLDGQTTNSSLVSNVAALSSTNGWVLDNATFGEYVAMTASYFTSSSTSSNRWLVTPKFSVPTPAAGSSSSLEWSSASLGIYFLQTPPFDNLEVLVSTTDSNPSSFTPILSPYQEQGYTTHALNLAAYVGQKIRIAFRDTSLNGYGLLMTDIKIASLPNASASLNDLEIYEHNYLGTPINIFGTLTNSGIDTVTSYTLNYSVNGATAITYNATGLTFPSQTSWYYSHGTPFNPTTAGTYTIKTWFSAINGVAYNSDTQSATIYVYPRVTGTVRNVLLEEMTGAGCPWCPGGAFTLREVVAANPTLIPVAIHSSSINDLGTTPPDAMAIADGETVVSAVQSGLPSAMVDRLYTYDNQALGMGLPAYTVGSGTSSSWDTVSVWEKTNATPTNVSLSNMSFDTTSGALSVDVNATFLNSLSSATADFRLNMYLVEDSVITSGPGYNQDNGNYSSAGAGVSGSNAGALYTMPTVVTNDGQPGDWTQLHVLRYMAGGAWGTAGIIPNSPVAGTTYSKTYTTAVPSTWRTKFVSVIGVVQEYNSNVNKRQILNATETRLLQAGPNAIATIAGLSSLSVYPNPATSMAKVEMDLQDGAMVNISLINMLGQTVVQPIDVNLNAGLHTVNIPVSAVAAGLYYVKVSINGQTQTQTLSIEAK